jgi:hypothetical protein
VVEIPSRLLRHNSPPASANNRGVYIYDTKTNGKTYQLKGKETHHGKCHTGIPE